MTEHESKHDHDHDPSDITSAVRVIAEADDITHKTAVYHYRRRLALRGMLGTSIVAILGLGCLFVYGRIVSIPSTIAEWPTLYAWGYIVVVSIFLASVGLGFLGVEYYKWRLSGIPATETHYLEYPDGSREVASKQDVVQFLHYQHQNHHYDDISHPQPESQSESDRQEDNT